MESNQFCLNFVDFFNNLKIFNVQNTFSIEKVLTDVRSLATCRESSEAFTLIHQIVLNVSYNKNSFLARLRRVRVCLCACAVCIFCFVHAKHILAINSKSYF